MTGNKLIQRYKIYSTTYCINVYGWYYQNLDIKSWTIDIEIKQNKEEKEENMEEEREYTEEEFKNNPRFQHHKNIEQIINMKKLKEFDINLAKQGKPVCTRDGRKARIICFDAKGDNPIIALIEMGVAETPNNYPIDGKAIPTKETPCDLMMLPEMKEGWVNVYKGGLLDTKSYNTKKEAFDKASPEDYVDTVKINWSE